MPVMSIGELSRRTGASVATIRYYEDAGLMPVPARSRAGRRIYTDGDIRRLETIRTLRALGFPVKDIARSLGSAADCSSSREVAELQLSQVEAQIARLRAVAESLATRIAACGSGCASRAIVGCPILQP
jgi:DNA-binding transcriptional MerR regulator